MGRLGLVDMSVGEHVRVILPCRERFFLMEITSFRKADQKKVFTGTKGPSLHMNRMGEERVARGMAGGNRKSLNSYSEKLESKAHSAAKKAYKEGK